MVLKPIIHNFSIFRLLIPIYLILTATLPVSAYDFEVDGIYYSKSQNSTVVVVSGDNKYSGDITIPERVSYNTSIYTVISIGYSAFKDCTGLTSVTIPNSVTSIGSNAFDGCSGLTSVIIPISVTDIGWYAFRGCTGLTSVSIGNSVTSIGECAFDGCSGLTSITIPNSVTSIGECAFYACRSLTSVTIPNSVTSIGHNPFAKCTNLCEIIVDNNPNFCVVDGILYDKSMTRLICCPLGEKGSFIIPDGIQSIDKYAFSNCTGLTSISIPNSVTSIGGWAFTGCSGLTSISIPNSVTSIGTSAFSHCTGLTSVSIPNSVIIMDSWTFFCCKNLEKFIVEDNNPNFCLVDGILYDKTMTSLICCPGGKKGSIIIPDGIQSIDDGAFSFCSGLTSISIPNSVTTIGIWAFDRCTSLTSITIPNSVTSIDNYAFSGCSGLTNIVIYPEILVDFDSFDLSPIFYVPESMVDDYKAEYPNFTVLPNSEVGNNRFVVDNTFEIRPNQTLNLSVTLTNAEIVSDFQTDISLPEGLSIAEKSGNLDISFGEGTADASHVISASRVAGDNTYRIIAYSTKNLPFKSGDAILNISIVANSAPKKGEILIGNSVINLINDTSVNPDNVSISVPADIKVTKITVSPKQEIVNRGQTLQLSATIEPSSAWIQDIVWSVSDESVASINSDGLLTPKSKGSITVTATATDGSDVFDSAVITVTNNVLDISIGDNIEIEEDEVLTLSPILTPADPDDISILWVSSDSKVAYVDKENVLHALTPGNVTITAITVIPDVSASISVTVTPVMYGDANDNGMVDIDDVVKEVQYILEKQPDPFHFKKADINRDRTINVIDVSKTVSLTLSEQASQPTAMSRFSSADISNSEIFADDVSIAPDRSSTLTINMGENENITAIQADIQLPAGISVSDISLNDNQNDDHIVDFISFDDNNLRFVIYSLSLSCFAPNSPMLDLELECDDSFTGGEIIVKNILSSDVKTNLQAFNNLTINVSKSSGINEILGVESDKEIDVYNLQGLLIKQKASSADLKTLRPGIYIIRRADGSTAKLRIG